MKLFAILSGMFIKLKQYTLYEVDMAKPQKRLRIVTDCDFEANACYIKVSNKKITKSVKQEDPKTNLEYVLDFDEKGDIVGVEILNLAKAAVLGLLGLSQIRDLAKIRA